MENPRLHPAGRPQIWYFKNSPDKTGLHKVLLPQSWVVCSRNGINNAVGKKECHGSRMGNSIGKGCTISFYLLVINKYMWLRPVYYLSEMCTIKVIKYHWYTEEAATGIWEIYHLRHFIYVKELSCVTDWSFLVQFLNGYDLTSHIIPILWL